MKGIRELKWEELSGFGVVKRAFYGNKETVAVDMPQTFQELRAQLERYKVLVAVGDNLTMTPEEGGESRYTTHHAVALFHVEEIEGNRWAWVVDPDDTVSHPTMDEIREYARAHEMEAWELSHSQIIEATGKPDAMVRRIHADDFLENMQSRSAATVSGHSNASDVRGFFEVKPVSGVSVEESRDSGVAPKQEET